MAAARARLRRPESPETRRPARRDDPAEDPAQECEARRPHPGGHDLRPEKYARADDPAHHGHGGRKNPEAARVRRHGREGGGGTGDGYSTARENDAARKVSIVRGLKQALHSTRGTVALDGSRVSRPSGF